MTENQEQEMQAPQEPSAEEQVGALKDQLLRVVAELDNTRKRSEREKIEAHKYAVHSFARDLLPVADSLSKALDIVQKQQGFEAVIEGLKMTQDNLLKTFERNGIVRIAPLHEKFDHNVHQAMFEVPTDAHAAGTVVELLQDGYMLHDRLLRPALVGVSKGVS